MNTDNTPLHTYQLIDYSKPPPILPVKESQLTENEAHNMNQAFGLNGTTLRYIRKDG
jgi:hypothetical protein